MKNVHNKINTALFQKSILIKEYFYSFRHKKSIKKNLGPPCFDKKPNPFFINKAIKKYNLDLINSWVIGDRQTDIDCGKRAGIKTIGVISKNYLFNKKNKPDFSIKNIVNKVGLHDTENKLVKFYSQGMLQRLKLATALILNPDILLLDEPLAGLDAEGIQLFESLYTEWRGGGKTMLIVSHDPDWLSSKTDRIIELN